jgi:hypothetical protein
MKLLPRITPADVLAECRQLAHTSEMRRKEEKGWAVFVFAPPVILTVWLLVGIAAGALMAAHIYR